jgi:predicted nucleotidyltransferase
MRKSGSGVLEALFPPTRSDVLVALFGQPQRWWYLSELAEHLGTRPSSLQRELASLVAAGILERRQEGRRTYYRAETRAAVYPELHELVEKTAGLIPTLQRALEPMTGKIECAFVYGSVARGEEAAASDVDLMVVGSGGLAGISPALRKAEARLGREVNATTFTAREFRSKAARGDHFVVALLRGPKIFVIGGQDDLDKAAGQ